MVVESAPDRPFEPPVAEAFEPLAPIGPVRGHERRVGESGDMQQHLLDGYLVLAVGSELRNDVGHALVHVELALFHQQPRSARHDGFGAREHAVHGLVGGRPFSTALHRLADSSHRADLAFARDRDLSRGQQPVFHLALGAHEQGLDLGGIESHFSGIFCEEMISRHYFALA